MVQDPLTDALIGRLKTFGGNHRLSAFPKMDGSHVSGTSIKHKSPSQELERTRSSLILTIKKQNVFENKSPMTPLMSYYNMY